jgi:hypothetical protein
MVLKTGNFGKQIKFCVVLKVLVLFYVLFVLCRSVYCLCVNVYCTIATRWNPIAVNKYIIIIFVVLHAGVSHNLYQ